jgi:hypothetical protein
MAVDTNIGYNKTNAVVESRLIYDLDLADLTAPLGSLTMVHKNHATGILVCKQWDKIRLEGESSYPVDDCYWNYLRVYLPTGTRLLEAVPQYIPTGWLTVRQETPPQVDTLDEELTGVQGFGTLLIVPVGEMQTTSFRFALPASIIQPVGSGQLVYQLKVQKQPGTLAVPLTLRLHFSNGVNFQTLPAGAVQEGSNLLFETDLQIDREFQVVFTIP